MNKERLETWEESLKQSIRELSSRLSCMNVNCDTCPLTNESGKCQRHEIRKDLRVALELVQKELRPAEKCEKCGKIVDGEE